MRLEDTAYGRSFLALLKDGGFDEAEGIFSAASERYAALAAAQPEMNEKESFHVLGNILPMAAAYLTLKERCPDDALRLMYDVARPVSSAKGERFRSVTEKGGGRGIFLAMLSNMVKDLFGGEAGFGLEILEEGTERVSFDVTSCPYARLCGELGCPELTPVFCRNDEYAYGNLRGIEFRRKDTIGRGGEACDFRFIRTE